MVRGDDFEGGAILIVVHGEPALRGAPFLLVVVGFRLEPSLAQLVQ